MRRVSWNFYFRSWQRERIGHASHEACELKFLIGKSKYLAMCHASHEACELKWLSLGFFSRSICHASHEACELKYNKCFLCFAFQSVTPRMRRVSWNSKCCGVYFYAIGSRLAWGVWVEISCTSSISMSFLQSRLAWGVWVEIFGFRNPFAGRGVTPRMRRVSWNIKSPRRLLCRFRHASHEACELKCGKGGNERPSVAVTPRMRRVSWNTAIQTEIFLLSVTPRMRRVSWNVKLHWLRNSEPGHASHEACELKSASLSASI